jgi:DNA-binding GntR family transcriptional regulator
MAADQGVTRSPTLYRKVAEDIKAAIAAGGYAAGTRLPSEHELAERYSVSRGPIRQAFAALRADGVIASRRGARRVVVGGPRVQSFGELLSFSRWARALGEVPGGQVIAMQRRPAKPTEAERLALPAGAGVSPDPGPAAVRAPGDDRARRLPGPGGRAGGRHGPGYRVDHRAAGGAGRGLR